MRNAPVSRRSTVVSEGPQTYTQNIVCLTALQAWQMKTRHVLCQAIYHSTLAHTWLNDRRKPISVLYKPDISSYLCHLYGVRRHKLKSDLCMPNSKVWQAALTYKTSKFTQAWEKKTMLSAHTGSTGACDTYPSHCFQHITWRQQLTLTANTWLLKLKPNLVDISCSALGVSCRCCGCTVRATWSSELLSLLSCSQNIWLLAHGFSVNEQNPVTIVFLNMIGWMGLTSRTARYGKTRKNARLLSCCFCPY